MIGSLWLRLALLGDSSEGAPPPPIPPTPRPPVTGSPFDRTRRWPNLSDKYREYQFDFSTGSVVGTSFDHRPDAISLDYLWSMAPGPIALNDPSEGLVARAWYVRIDNDLGEAWICGDEEDVVVGDPEPPEGWPRKWGVEQLLFTFAGTPIEESQLCFDQNGAPFLATLRGSNVWLRYFSPAISSFVFEDFGAGASPRCILDDPSYIADSDILVFYRAGGTLRYRHQRDLYVTEFDTTVFMSSNQYVERCMRSTGNRVHVFLSTRSPTPGTWAISRVSSRLYPILAGPDPYALTNEALEASNVLVVIVSETPPDDQFSLINPAHEAACYLSLEPVPVEEQMEYSVEFTLGGVEEVLILYEPPPDEWELQNEAISGDCPVIQIKYLTDPEEDEWTLANEALSGTLVVV